ncbi:hypothetical protein [Bordetella genomosp. 11]|uniref:Tautomerase family protein n=1 Tax=Bordetella genomosp. 11 TaxID=1416808 RepID=A0A261UP28_9BORD|nr:hypothetical protein [Bordetella genomosp. 11]OZI63020.1 hypothetical protein CAL28_28325 [Bordetella genomosp. 11]
MPNITFYIDARQMPSDKHLAELSDDCVQLCTIALDAELKNVHVVYVDVRHGHGHPVFVEVHYRLGRLRTRAVMDQFMEALDNAIAFRTGLMARIRCFGYAASNIHARN